MREKPQFAWAVLVSLLLHLLVLVGTQYSEQLARIPLLRPLAGLLAPSPSAAPPPAATAPARAEPVITFVQAPAAVPPSKRQFMETDSTQVTGEQPKTAEYYSDRATVAANPDNPSNKTGDTPYLEGSGTKVMSTVDVRPGSAAPPPAPQIASRPPSPQSPPPPAVKASATPVEKPPAETGLKVIQETKLAAATPPTMPLPNLPPSASATPPTSTPLSMARPSPPTLPPPVPGPAGTGNEREIAARKSRLTSSGTAKIGIAAFNVAESPFGAYDKIVVRAVQSRWYALIEQNSLYERAGQVTLRFQMLEDGTVQAMEIKENTAGQVLALFCEKAVSESAPFAPLPAELRVLIGKEPREVNFTFYY